MKKFYVYDIKVRFLGVITLIIAYLAIVKVILPTLEDGFSEHNPYSKIGFYSAFIAFAFCIYFSIREFLYFVLGRPISLDKNCIINYKTGGKIWKKIYYANIIMIKKPKIFSKKFVKPEKKQKVTLIDKKHNRIYIYNDILHLDWKEREDKLNEQGKIGKENYWSLFGIDEIMEQIMNKIDKDKCKIIEY